MISTGSAKQPGQRIVVTGIGVVSPVGCDGPSFWDAIVAGKSGIARITRFDPTGYQTTFAGVSGNSIQSIVWDERTHAEPTVIPTLPSRRHSRHFERSGLVIDDGSADRVGVLIGSGMGR